VDNFGAEYLLRNVWLCVGGSGVGNLHASALANHTGGICHWHGFTYYYRGEIQMSDDKKICPTCNGNGYIMDSDGEQSAAIDCPTCDSQGELSTKETD